MQATSGGVLFFGGTARQDEAHDTAFGDTWLFSDGTWGPEGTWIELNLTQPDAPRPRWGHSLACTPPAWLEPEYRTDDPPPRFLCTLFGGANLSEDDHFDDTVRARRGRLSALSVFLLKSILYGAFVWARRALNSEKRRFPARAVAADPGNPRPWRRRRQDPAPRGAARVEAIAAGCRAPWPQASRALVVPDGELRGRGADRRGVYRVLRLHG